MVQKTLMKRCAIHSINGKDASIFYYLVAEKGESGTHYGIELQFSDRQGVYECETLQNITNDIAEIKGFLKTLSDNLVCPISLNDIMQDNSYRELIKN